MLAVNRVPIFLACEVSLDTNQISRHTIISFDNHNSKSDSANENDEENSEDNAESILDRQFGTTNVNHPSDVIDHNNDDEDPEYDDYDDEVTFSRNKRSLLNLAEIEYIWYHNNEVLVSSSQRNISGYKLFPNGTLRILPSVLSAGNYRCLGREFKLNMGGLISKETKLEVASK